jgi:hypothetical protein
MKKTLLAITFLLSSALMAFAQDGSSSTEKRVNMLTRIMASELGLNESEYLRLKTLNRERVVKSDEIAELYSLDLDLQNKKIQELEASFDKKLKVMLSPDQLELYNAYRKSPETELALSQPKGQAAKKE